MTPDCIGFSLLFFCIHAHLLIFIADKKSCSKPADLQADASSDMLFSSNSMIWLPENFLAESMLFSPLRSSCSSPRTAIACMNRQKHYCLLTFLTVSSGGNADYGSALSHSMTDNAARRHAFLWAMTSATTKPACKPTICVLAYCAARFLP